MSSKEIADRFGHTLSALPFVEAISSNHTVNGVKVLCRVAAGHDKAWAGLVEKILRAGISSSYATHICRLYFLHNGSMVYGWHVGITSDSIQDSLDVIIPLIIPPRPSIPKPGKAPRHIAPYSPPLQADAKGNPIVDKQVTEMAFTGMEGMSDRNTPRRGSTKGAYYSGSKNPLEKS